MKHLFFVAVSALLSFASPAMSNAAEATVEVVVHKSPTCGCCGNWEKHLEKEGFAVKSVVGDEVATKDQFAIPKDRRSCHTGVVGGYFIEGHVPAEAIRRLLKEKPKHTKGLAVPGMPIGSPGMELGSRVDPYVVYRIDDAGKSTVWESYPKTAKK